MEVELFKRKKLKKTKARKVILEEIKKVKTHPTAYELFNIVKKKLPRVSLGTIYRNLDVMSENGLITKIKTNDSQTHFDGRTEDHYHIQCIECGRIDDVELDILKGIDTIVEERIHYKVLYHTINFYGLCPECLKKRKKQTLKNDLLKTGK